LVEKIVTVKERDSSADTTAWEREIDHPLMSGVLNLAQITLACALGFEARIPDLHWRPGHPKLCEWFDHVAARPSFAATAPPAASLSGATPNEAP